MSPLLCRIILVDHASRRPLWDAQAATAPAETLTPLDPRPFASWDVSALAAVYQVGAGPCALADAAPCLARLQACKSRICFARDQDHVLAILEKKERTPVDIAAMRREIDMLIRATTPPDGEETPWEISIVPAAESPSDASGHGRPTCGKLPAGVRPLVLVEDEMMVRSVCQRILGQHFLVFEMAGSLDALALVDRVPFPIHLLVSDISLPRMDGVALAHRWLQRSPDARVLLLSGNPHAAAALPEVAFMQKPFLADDLVRAVLQLAQPKAKATTR